MNWTVEWLTGIKHEAMILKITCNFSQQKEVNLPLVPYCTHLFEKYLFEFHSTSDLETEHELIHEHSDKPLF
jgi:hypothetical protein